MHQPDVEGLASITLHSHNNFKSLMELMALSFHISVSPICSVTLMKAIFSGPGRFTITSVTVGADHDLINVTFVQVCHVTCDDYGLLSTTYNMKSFSHIDVHHTMTVDKAQS